MELEREASENVRKHSVGTVQYHLPSVISWSKSDSARPNHVGQRQLILTYHITEAGTQSFLEGLVLLDKLETISRARSQEQEIPRNRGK